MRGFAMVDMKNQVYKRAKLYSIFLMDKQGERLTSILLRERMFSYQTRRKGGKDNMTVPVRLL